MEAIKQQDLDIQQNTRTQLLDAAEFLFAEHGIDATSLRAITSQADANLAAVHYYFNSKEGLVQAVFARRFDPLNEDRLHRLDAIEQAHGGSPPPVEEIIEAFIAPALKRLRKHESKAFMKLMGRVYGNPSEMQKCMNERFLNVVQRFIDAFQRALPNLSHEEVLSRFKFLVGAMVIILIDPMSDENAPSLARETHQNLISNETPLCHVVTFLSAGMRAPSSAAVSSEE